MKCYRFFLGFLVSASACMPESATSPTESANPGSGPLGPIPTASISLSSMQPWVDQKGTLIRAAGPPVAVAGIMRVHVWAVTKDANGKVVSDRPVAWANSNESVAHIYTSCAPTQTVCQVIGILPLADGETTITASANGLKTSTTVLVSMDPAASSGLVIEEFTVTAVGSDSGGWGYAPQFAVTTTIPFVKILGIEFDLPGVHLARFCGETRPLAPSVQLFGERYGDFTLMIVAPPGPIAPWASATIYFLDQRQVRKVTVPGTVKAGSFPSTYTGGSTDMWETC